METRVNFARSLNALMLGSCMLAPGAMLAAELRPFVIYGDDDRKDVYDASNADEQLVLAASTVALVKRTDLTADARDTTIWKLPTETLQESYRVCASEPFKDQPNPAFCSGFLVAPDIIVTAGHCITSDADCATTSFIFDFAYKNANDTPTNVLRTNRYNCREVIHTTNPGAEGSTGESDFAVVKLDRPVTDRAPLQFRRSGQIAQGTQIGVIGHPTGLPTKIAFGPNTKVRSNTTTEPFFVANLDTYGGNSGSAVFNQATGDIEGILVRGETDFTMRGSCRVSYVCTNDRCRGEDVTKSTEFARYVP